MPQGQAKMEFTLRDCISPHMNLASVVAKRAKKEVKSSNHWITFVFKAVGSIVALDLWLTSFSTWWLERLDWKLQIAGLVNEKRVFLRYLVFLS